MIVVGLTGSIGMGKSTATRAFARLGVPVFDADATVHALLARGGAAVPAIAAAFPGVVVEGAVDRERLGRDVFGQPDKLKALERIVHPLVRREEQRFLMRAKRAKAPLVVLDIPLLFEGRGKDRVDRTVVVSAPPFVQRKRVMARPGMTEAKFTGILARQMPDAEKRRRADFVIPTGAGKHFSLRRIRRLVTILSQPGSRRRTHARNRYRY